MPTALHIMALVAELQREVIGGQIVSTEFYKKQRAVYFFIKKGSSHHALGFVYHPAGYGVFVVPASKLSIDTSEKPRSIFKLEDAMIVQVAQIGFDRIFQIILEKEGEGLSIVFESLGPNGNIWLLDSRSAKRATLRQRLFNEGDKYEPPLLPEKLNPTELSVKSIRERINWEKGLHFDVLAFVQKQILGLNHTLAQEIILESGLGQTDLNSLSDDALNSLIRIINDVVKRFECPEGGYLYQLADKIEVYPFKLPSVAERPEKFGSFSLAVQAAINRHRAQVESAGEQKRITDAVKQTVKRLERRQEKIKDDIKDASEYERYKKFGELLQINFGKIRKGMDSISLEDVYADRHETITIELDPSLSPADNVEAYFRKYRKGREGLRLLQRRLTVTQNELKQWTTIQSELEKDFASAGSRYAQEIASLLPKEKIKGHAQPRLPYRELTLSTGVKIFVGRGGADNDRTTFEYAKPYELWFHTQQCPGSHVVMKFPNKSYQPSKREIEEAASIAAYYSKAKNDSLVPVVYTQRKYVRKPRKTKAGLVTVEREKSVMVTPQKPRESRKD
jgi:predicted ribosome quality control (RQC) complex YloA/Tae2 family protein